MTARFTAQDFRQRFRTAKPSPGSVVSLFTAPLSSADKRPVRVALVGTFAPRKCGIATFTTDIREQLARHQPDIGVEIYALDSVAAPLVYEAGTHVIPSESVEAYRQAARRINESGVDAVWLQHEYGVYGGVDGELVCEFVDHLAPPLVLTLHTVLTHPSDHQREILAHLIARASRIMVMSAHGRDILLQDYAVPGHIVEVIPHGAPDRPFGREAEFKRRLGLANSNVLMTFGLLGPGKGLERVIEALPAIVARHPDTVYRIVGATHPNLVAREGERYRESLKDLARDLGVEAHVIWEDRFLDTDELLDQLEACDIYITPYPNLQQSTSGTLSYAVALGKAVVSTPYVHARELLADGAGVLIEPGSARQVAEAVNGLLDDPAALAAMKHNAYARGRTTIWPEFARSSADLVRRAVAPRFRDVPVTATPGLSSVFAMSDGTGMLQHSIGIVPDRRHGYCLDDNVRALQLMNVAEGLSVGERRRWSVVYASFLQFAWNPEARRFRNFMHFDRTWCEDVGSDDSNGRALWALGHTVELAPDPDLRSWAMRWFDEVSPVFTEMDDWPRTMAFAMLGSASVLRTVGRHPVAEQILDRGGTVLASLLDKSRRPDWTWFEAALGYDNPRLPQSLIEAGVLRGRNDWLGAGLETLRWVADRQTSAAGHFRPVGSETFGLTHAALPFDQQPLEAQAAVEAARTAWEATGDRQWIDRALTAYRWYFGANDRGVVLADLASGSCRDGVTPRGINENTGAESILAFQLAHYGIKMLRLHGSSEEQGEKLESRARNLSQSTARQ